MAQLFRPSQSLALSADQSDSFLTLPLNLFGRPSPLVVASASQSESSLHDLLTNQTPWYFLLIYEKPSSRLISYINMQSESFLTRFAELHMRILPDKILWPIRTLINTLINTESSVNIFWSIWSLPSTIKTNENLFLHHFLIFQNLSWHNCWQNRILTRLSYWLNRLLKHSPTNQNPSWCFLLTNQNPSWYFLSTNQNPSLVLLTKQILPITIRKTRCRHYSLNLAQTLDMLWMYTVKRRLRFSRLQTECHLPNSPWPGIM